MNELKHYAEFQTILENYQPSEAAKQVLKNITLVTLLGPSSAGRNTIIGELLKTGDFHFIISDTTRQPRENNGEMETNGSTYWFRSEEEVLRDLRDGKFLEAEIIHSQQVSGISIRELENAQKNHKIAITDVDVGGVKSVRRAKPDTLAIAVLPPSFEEWHRRVENRGQLSHLEKLRRFETAARIFEKTATSKELVIVINDDLKHAVTKIQNIIHHGQIDADEQEQGKKLADELYHKTVEFIKSVS